MLAFLKKYASPLVQEVFRKWHADKVAVLGSSMAFYALFSLFPLLLVVLSLVGAAFGDENTVMMQTLQLVSGGEITEAAAEQIDVNTQLYNILRESLTEQTAEQIETTLRELNQRGRGATIIGFAVLLIIASSAFHMLQFKFQIIWGLTGRTPPGPGIWGPVIIFLRRRLFGLALVIACALLLLVSMLVGVIITLLSRYTTALPGNAFLWQTIHTLVSLAIMTFVLMMLFKFLPDTPVTWEDVWLGALLTAVAFTIFTRVSSYVLTTGNYQAYGAVGSSMAFMLWVFLSSQMLFIGAEVTQVYATMYGSHREQPGEDALELARVAHMRLTSHILTRSGRHRLTIGRSKQPDQSNTSRSAVSSKQVKRRTTTASIVATLAILIAPLVVGVLRAVQRFVRQEW